MTELPPESPGDLTIHIRELSMLARVNPVYYYAQVKEGKAPKPRRGRVPLRDALAWLERRAEKYADRAAAVERLRNRLAPAPATATVAPKEGGPPNDEGSAPPSSRNGDADPYEIDQGLASVSKREPTDNLLVADLDGNLTGQPIEGRRR